MHRVSLPAVLSALLLPLLIPVPLGAQQAVAFTNVTVVPMDTERLIEHQTVIIRDGRIAAMGAAASTQVPDGATVVDARGRFLMPGLAEMHAHIPPPRMNNLNLDEQWAYDVLALFVANGVTTIRGMLGHPWHLELREEVERGAVLGPRIWTSGPSVNGNSVQTPDSALLTPGYQQAQGYDFMKIHPGLTRAVFDSLDAAADRIGMEYAGHVPVDVGVTRALEAEYWSIDHLDGYIESAAGRERQQGGGWFGANFAPEVDPARLRVLAQATREAGVWNVPTQTLMEWYASPETAEQMNARPELQYIPPGMRQQWMDWKRGTMQNAPDAGTLNRYIDMRRQLIRDLQDAGAGLLLGSDAPQVFNVPGFAAHRELAAIVQAGLSPYEALVSGTRNVAEFFGVAEEAGTVAAGKWADLVLLRANPLANIGNAAEIEGVMVRGRWLPRAELDRILAEIAERYSS